MDTNHNVTLNVTVDQETAKNVRDTAVTIISAMTIGFVVKVLTNQGVRLATDLFWRKSVKL